MLWIACLLPMSLMWLHLLQGQIRGDWVKEITHTTGYYGLIILTVSLAITPLRKITGFNELQSYRRPLGLFAFFYICVHFLVIYVILDKQVPFAPGPAWHEIVKDIAKRPYITVGFTGWVLMIPLAITSTKGWIRRMGKKWTALHSLVYLTAMAGVIHFMWSVKADRARPITIGLILMALLALRLVPTSVLGRLRPARRPAVRPAAAEPSTSSA